MALLEIQNLNTWFHLENGLVKAVHDVDLTVEEGDILGLIGESGSGKSMLAKSVIGLVDPPGHVESGSIRFDGHELLTCSEKERRALRGRDISYLIQNPMSAFNPMHTVGRHLTDAVRLTTGCSRKQATAEALRLLDSVGLENAPMLARCYPHQFSGGMLQRAAIAMAVAGQPRLLIADEPTTALDVNLQGQILNLLSDLHRRLGMTILVITHNFAVVKAICTRVVVLYAGSIMEEGPVNALWERPSHPYTRLLLNALITLDRQPDERFEKPIGYPGARPEDGCPFYPLCPNARSLCRTRRPALWDLGGGHHVACHGYGKEDTPWR